MVGAGRFLSTPESTKKTKNPHEFNDTRKKISVHSSTHNIAFAKSSFLSMSESTGISCKHNAANNTIIIVETGTFSPMFI